MKRTSSLLTGLFLILFSASSSFAITWAPEEFTCPLDGSKNTFRVLVSYGSYIYSDRSQYQWVFFPRTSQQTYYMCKKCHLTTYMWDFKELPKEKYDALRKVLADVKVSKQFDDYQKIPVTERMEAMEKAYSVLDKDEVWWEVFYRAQAFHYAKAGLADKALKVRKKSLEMVTKFLSDEKHKDDQKLFYYISGAMKHYTNDDEGAIKDLEKALETPAADSTGKTKPEDLQQYEEGMNQRIKTYIELIKGDKKPRLSDKLGNYHDHDTDM